MKTFKDSTGRTWSVSITIGAIRRARAIAHVDLMGMLDPPPGSPPGTPKLITLLSTDPALACDVLYAVCKPEADAEGVTDTAFGERMTGPAIAAGQAALLEDAADFFVGLGRDDLATATRAHLTLVQTIVNAMSREMKELSPLPHQTPPQTPTASGPRSGVVLGLWGLIRRRIALASFKRWRGQKSTPTGPAPAP